MKNEIIIQIRSVYGEDKIYPICEKAKIFAAMAGTKTLTPHAISNIRKLGFEIRQAPTAAQIHFAA